MANPATKWPTKPTAVRYGANNDAWGLPATTQPAALADGELTFAAVSNKAGAVACAFDCLALLVYWDDECARIINISVSVLIERRGGTGR